MKCCASTRCRDNCVFCNTSWTSNIQGRPILACAREKMCAKKEERFLLDAAGFFWAVFFAVGEFKPKNVSCAWNLTRPGRFIFGRFLLFPRLGFGLCAETRGAEDRSTASGCSRCATHCTTSRPPILRPACQYHVPGMVLFVVSYVSSTRRKKTQ